MMHATIITIIINYRESSFPSIGFVIIFLILNRKSNSGGKPGYLRDGWMVHDDIRLCMMVLDENG